MSLDEYTARGELTVHHLPEPRRPARTCLRTRDRGPFERGSLGKLGLCQPGGTAAVRELTAKVRERGLNLCRGGHCTLPWCVEACAYG
jgi:hypothetical protein